MGVKVKEWKGAHWVFVNYKGKRKAKRVGAGAKGERAAMEVATQIQAKLALGDLSVLNPPAPVVPAKTFGQYAEEWMVAQAVRLRPLTATCMAGLIRHHLLPAFGTTPLSGLTKKDVKNVVVKWLTNGKVHGRGPLRPGSVKTILGVLRNILSGAVDDGEIPSNPAAKLGSYIREQRGEAEAEEPLKVFAHEELDRLLRVAKDTTPEWYPFLLTLARTGLRIGEALGLEWEDVSLDRRVLRVRRTWTRRRLGAPKSKRGRRTVDLTPHVCQVLAEWKSLQAAEAAVNGQAPPTAVFAQRSGDRWDDRWVVNNVWVPLLRRCALRHRGIHQLRHTYAVHLIEAGVHPKYIQAQLGHSRIATTLDTYAEFLPEGFPPLVNALDGQPTATPAQPESSETARVPGNHQVCP